MKILYKSSGVESHNEVTVVLTLKQNAILSLLAPLSSPADKLCKQPGHSPGPTDLNPNCLTL